MIANIRRELRGLVSISISQGKIQVVEFQSPKVSFYHGWTRPHWGPFLPFQPTVYRLAHCLKITQNVAFEFLNLGIFHQFLSYQKMTCLVTLFDRKL